MDSQAAQIVIAIALSFIASFLGYIIWKIRILDDMKTEVAVMGKGFENLQVTVKSLHEWKNLQMVSELEKLREDNRRLQEELKEA